MLYKTSFSRILDKAKFSGIVGNRPKTQAFSVQTYKQKWNSDMQISSTQAAAAVMLLGTESSEYRHYRWITEAVIETGLSRLGERGITPWETMARDIREKPELFWRADLLEPGEHPKGYVMVNREAALKDPVIQEAYDILCLWQDGGMLKLPD